MKIIKNFFIFLLCLGRPYKIIERWHGAVIPSPKDIVYSLHFTEKGALRKLGGLHEYAKKEGRNFILTCYAD